MIRVRCIVSQGQQALVELGDPLMLVTMSNWTPGTCLALILLGGCATTQKEDRDYLEQKNSSAQAARWHFDEDRSGEPPKGWSIRETTPTESLATWEAISDDTAPSRPNVMAVSQTRNYNGTFNLAIAEGTSFKDIDLTISVKAVGGEEDQGGGPIWRCLDQNNYYICRFNPLENNFRVYFVKNGKRRQLDSVQITTESGKWYTLRVKMVGEDISCYLDGKRLLEVEDSTFSESGMIGLWTKADAVTHFDDLTVLP